MLYSQNISYNKPKACCFIPFYQVQVNTSLHALAALLAFIEMGFAIFGAVCCCLGSKCYGYNSRVSWVRKCITSFASNWSSSEQNNKIHSTKIYMFC